MNCSRVSCDRESVHQHVGALETDAALCDPCFREWKEMNEKTRTLFVQHLATLQTSFLDARPQEPSVVEPESEMIITRPQELPTVVEVDPVITITEDDLDDSIILSDN